MEEQGILKIEEFVWRYKKKESSAARMISDIVGVYVGLKPAALISFKADEMAEVSCLEFRDLLGQAGIKAVFMARQFLGAHKLSWREEIFLAKDLETAVELKNNFVKLWGAMDDCGQILDIVAWEQSTREVGKLLGYPDTAVEAFVRENSINNNSTESLTVVEGYKYFAHSREYAEREVEQYDRPLDLAIKKYAPKTQKFLGI